MSETKCPFCQQELQETYDGKQFWCSNYKDPTHPINMLGTKELWQELARTKKQLEIAIDALKEIKRVGAWAYVGGLALVFTEPEIAQQALEQITALEQKEG